MKKCEVCDNCLQQKNIHLTTEEFTRISESISITLNANSVEIKSLLSNLKAYKKEKVWKVLNYLQAEGKLFVNEKGLVEQRIK